MPLTRMRTALEIGIRLAVSGTAVALVMLGAGQTAAHAQTVAPAQSAVRAQFVAPAQPAGEAAYLAAMQLFDEYRDGEARSLLALAAEAGHARAQTALAMMTLYTPAWAGSEDPVQVAQRWLRRAAQQGDPSALHMLAFLDSDRGRRYAMHVREVSAAR